MCLRSNSMESVGAMRSPPHPLPISSSCCLRCVAGSVRALRTTAAMARCRWLRTATSVSSWPSSSSFVSRLAAGMLKAIRFMRDVKQNSRPCPNAFHAHTAISASRSSSVVSWYRASASATFNGAASSRLTLSCCQPRPRLFPRRPVATVTLGRPRRRIV